MNTVLDGGTVVCPGKVGSSFYGAPWRRDLTTDMRVVLEWGPTLMVSILEPHELAMLHVPELGTVVQAAGVAWRLLPIRDGDVPDERFDRGWPALSQELRNQLGAGNASCCTAAAAAAARGWWPAAWRSSAERSRPPLHHLAPFVEIGRLAVRRLGGRMVGRGKPGGSAHAAAVWGMREL